MPLFGRAPVPLGRHLEIPWHTFSLVVHHTQLELGIGISLFSKGFPFTRGRCVSLLTIYRIAAPGDRLGFTRGRCVSFLIIGG